MLLDKSHTYTSNLTDLLSQSAPQPLLRLLFTLSLQQDCHTVAIPQEQGSLEVHQALQLSELTSVQMGSPLTHPIPFPDTTPSLTHSLSHSLIAPTLTASPTQIPPRPTPHSLIAPTLTACPTQIPAPVSQGMGIVDHTSNHCLSAGNGEGWMVSGVPCVTGGATNTLLKHSTRRVKQHLWGTSNC